MTRSVAACLALLFASNIAPPCIAEPNGVATRLVQYDDLDLSTPAGVKALHRRIVLAADRVCEDASGPAPGAQVDLACSADAVKTARAQMPRAIAEQRQSKSRAVAEAGPR
jgi:UrcA family protein